MNRQKLIELLERFEELMTSGLVVDDELTKDCLKTIKELRQEEENAKDKIALVWSIEDVLGHDKDLIERRETGDTPLTEDQAREVLQQADRYHDADYGVCWDTLEVYISSVRAGAYK